MFDSESNIKLIQAAELIQKATHVVAFSGAGISVESGIPPFRGENGLWAQYDPKFLDIDYFQLQPEKAWPLIKEIFYDYFGQANPNEAHQTLAKMESAGILDTVITQNIDNLHQLAGSKNVLEFHGHSRSLICMNCAQIHPVAEVSLDNLPPLCSECGGLLKPEFIFFGEGIPEPAHSLSMQAAEMADVFMIIGSTGEIMPASLIPAFAKDNGATIIEINVQPSNYTATVSDIFIQGRATEVFRHLANVLKLNEGI